MTLRSSLALLALSGLFTACSGDDTDTEDEVDTEAGTEAPKNTALPDGTTGFSGTMTYDSTTTGFDEAEADINRSCSAEFTITGDEFAGDCDGCDWAFTLSATETSSDCGDDADLTRTLQVPQVAELNGTNVLAFWEILDGQQGTYTDVLAIVTPIDAGLGFGDAIGLYYYGDAYGVGSFDIVDSSFSWTIDGAEARIVRAPNGATACLTEGIIAPSSALEAADDSGTTVEGSILCPPDESDAAYDVYTITATEGDTITLSVDTVADATAFDPSFSVLSPSGCSVVAADDSFDCAFEPTDWQCPGIEFVAPETGDYRILVQNLGSCQDDSSPGGYQISTNASAIVSVETAAALGEFTVDLTSTIDIAVDVSFE